MNAKIEQFKTLKSDLIDELEQMSIDIKQLQTRRDELVAVLYDTTPEAQMMNKRPSGELPSLSELLPVAPVKKATAPPRKKPVARKSPAKKAAPARKTPVKKAAAAKTPAKKTAGTKVRGPNDGSNVARIVSYVSEHPGISKQELRDALSDLTAQQLKSALGGARSRGFIENRGPKVNPAWHVK